MVKLCRFPYVLPLFLCALLALSTTTSAEDSTVVVRDGEASLTYDELDFLVSGWSPQMRTAAIEDKGDRLELLNAALANKKVAARAGDMVADNPALKLRYEFGLRAYQRGFVLEQQQQLIEQDLPDFEELAKERYRVNRDKIAVNPEKRLSSHILFASPPGVPRGDVLAEAQRVLDELLAGADFVEMVKLHSDEPNAAAKQGSYNYWMTFGDKNVSPPYSQAVFEIEKVGDYSGLVQTQFGVHIIRLDGVQEQTYKSFEEMRPELVDKLRREYVSLAMKDFLAQFHIGDDAFIDGEAVDRILAPYQDQE